MSHLATYPPPSTAKLELAVYLRQRSWTVPLTPDSIVTIGRNPNSTIHLDDMSVSRRHAELYVGEHVEAVDLGSSGGTTLVAGGLTSNEDPQTCSNNRLPPNQRVRVRPGDVLRVGTVLIALQLRGHAASSRPKGGSAPILLDSEMRRAYDLVKRAAATEIAVLILGETGVGKELMAETVHQYSPRSGRPFLKLNCAALTDTLLESELFGHERGAFTGAHSAKAGLLESTDGGTVFLDEIGELPLGTQAKLLRVLEERSVIRVGATKPRRIDVRFVTATNRDLSQRVRSGEFRRDLYYRISGLVVQIPPLRQRQTEIQPLALHFLRVFCQNSGQGDPHLTPGAVEVLLNHGWPGNVRELRNVMERAALMANGEAVGPDHILLESDGEPALLDAAFDADTAVLRPALNPEFGAESERERILHALDACAGNQTRAAKQLGISRRTLINRLDAFNLPRPKKAVRGG